MSMIRLSDALDCMSERLPSGEPKPFDIVFITLDRKRNTGGEIKRIKNAIRCGQSHSTKDNNTIGVAPKNEARHVYCVHQWLITEFNGKPVYL